MLAAARTEFAAAGYDATSVRTIAARAGVDPAMIHHHFGGKRPLFLATLAIPVDPVAEVDAVITGGDDHDLGPRLVRHLLQVWDSPAGAAASAMIKTALQHEETAAAVRGFVAGELLPLLSDDPLARALAGVQLGGLIFGRYLLAVPSLADADPEDLVATLGPVLQAILRPPS